MLTTVATSNFATLQQINRTQAMSKAGRNTITNAGGNQMATGWRLYQNYDRLAFGERVTEERMALGLSLTGFAQRAGINKGTLQQAEAGKRSLPVPVRAKIVNALVKASEAKSISTDGDRLGAIAGLADGGPIGRRRFVELVGLTAAAALLPVSPVSGPGRGARVSNGREGIAASRYWLEVGIGRTANVDHEKATEAYELAEHWADLAGNRGTKALALAHQARSWRRLSDYDRAWDRSIAVLDELGLDDLPPERGIPIDRIEARIADDTELEAYALVSQLRAHALHDLEDFARAELALVTLENIGLLHSESGTQAEAKLFFGRILVERATDASDRDEWRSLKEPVEDYRPMLDRAVKHFQTARALRPKSDWQWHAHNWYHEARATRLLEGKTKAAVNAEREAERLFKENGSRAIANLLLTQGRWYAAESDREATAAEGKFLETLSIAWDIRSGLLLSGAFAGLSELYASSRSAMLRQQALDYCLAAIIAWPSSRHTRDFLRMERLFRDLDGSTSSVFRELKDGLEGIMPNEMAPPFDIVSMMPYFTHEEFIHDVKLRLERLAFQRGHA